MAVSNIPVLTSAILHIDTDIAEAAVVIKASSAVLYELEIDNTNNATAGYLKLYNAASPTVGTTAPDWIVMIPASVSRVIVIPSGLTFATALVAACVTAGGTAGVTGPTSNVTMRAVYV